MNHRTQHSLVQEIVDRSVEEECTMEVTDIRVNLINSESGVKAIGSFALDGMFAVRGVRVMEDKKGRNFVAFPAREKSNGEYEDIAFPLNKEFYHTLTEAIVTEYKKQVEEKQSPIIEEEQAKAEEKAATPAKKGKSR